MYTSCIHSYYSFISQNTPVYPRDGNHVMQQHCLCNAYYFIIASHYIFLVFPSHTCLQWEILCRTQDRARLVLQPKISTVQDAQTPSTAPAPHVCYVGQDKGFSSFQ